MNYDSDLTDSQWELIADIIPHASNIKINRRILVNAVLYLTKNGCQWRQLPKEYPHWKTVYTFFSRCKKKNVWENIMNQLVVNIHGSRPVVFSRPF